MRKKFLDSEKNFFLFIILKYFLVYYVVITRSCIKRRGKTPLFEINENIIFTKDPSSNGKVNI